MNEIPNLIEPYASPVEAVLERALEDARAGKLAQIILIGVSAQGEIGFSWHGQHATALLGAELFKRQLLDSLTTPASPIIKPRMS